MAGARIAGGDFFPQLAAEWLELVPPALPVVRTLPGASFYTTQLIPIGWTLSLQVNLDQIGDHLKLYARDHQQWSPVIIPASVISASSPMLWQSGKNLVKIRTGWVKFYCTIHMYVHLSKSSKSKDRQAFINKSVCYLSRSKFCNVVQICRRHVS